VTAAVVAGVLLGAVLLVSGASKLASAGWPAQAHGLGAPPWTVPVVPWTELVLGALVASGLGRPWPALAAVALLGAFTTLLAVRLAQGRRPPCACFGRFSARPISAWSVVRNLVLIGLGLVAALAS
jgi:hypothetical protein